MTTLYSEVMSVFESRCVSCVQQKDGFCLWNQSVSLCLFIGELRPLIVREIKVHSVFILVCFMFVVGTGIVCGFTLPFILCFRRVGLYIAYVYVSVVNFLRLEFSFQYFL